MVEKINPDLVGIKKTKRGGFTLIELLIFIGILRFLITAVLLAISPAELWKKTRDTRRIKDTQRLQTTLDRYVQETPPVNITGCLTSQCHSNNAVTFGTPQPCDSNWLQINVCQYTQTVPVDPRNRLSTQFVNGSGPGLFITSSGAYIAKIRNGYFEVVNYFESESNRNKLTNDGGNSSIWYEVGTKLSL